MLAEQLGVDINEIIAIGDQDNDVEMLREAGLGIIVENTSPSLNKLSGSCHRLMRRGRPGQIPVGAARGSVSQLILGIFLFQIPPSPRIRKPTSAAARRTPSSSRWRPCSRSRKGTKQVIQEGLKGWMMSSSPFLDFRFYLAKKKVPINDIYFYCLKGL